ncbi:MAG: hypothetical protein JRN62_02735 [Nitrososphaerota archaeon]|jgi:hypothetical protein|nr:hypothetical protein [Nitrososphaerota archaeon]MDG6948912.1 hypothetical protein [Nitrososphaerota archaeon]
MGRSQVPLCNYLQDDDMIEYLRFKDYAQAIEYVDLIKGVLTRANDAVKIKWRGGKETGLSEAVFPWIEWHFGPIASFRYIVKILIDRRAVDEATVAWLITRLKAVAPAIYRTVSDADLTNMIDNF